MIIPYKITPPIKIIVPPAKKIIFCKVFLLKYWGKAERIFFMLRKLLSIKRIEFCIYIKQVNLKLRNISKMLFKYNIKNEFGGNKNSRRISGNGNAQILLLKLNINKHQLDLIPPNQSIDRNLISC